MTVEYPPALADFFASLGDPQYGTPDNDPAQSILLWGTLNNARTYFYASPSDVHDYGRDIYARAIAGDFGPIANYPVEPSPGGSS